MHTTRGDGFTDIKRRRRDLSGDGVRKITTVSGRGRLKRGSRIIYVAMTSGLQSGWELLEYAHVIINNIRLETPTPTRDQSGPFAPPVPKTAKQLAVKRNQERVKSILLLAIHDEYLLKFHNIPDAKSLWEAIKSRVYEDEMKRSSSSTLNSQNLAFLSSENTSKTNEVSTASGNFGVNTAGGTNSSS
ncbi:hypothetical protein Tco_0898897 [Tanacetum coccineum]